MLHFKYIKYRFTLKEKFLANETIHLRKHLRFITNKGFYHDFSGRATFENPLSHPTLNVLFWRIVDSGYPIIPHLFPTIHYHHPRDGRCHPKLEIERSTCAELIRSLIQSDREYQLRNARRMPWKKRGSFEILCEVISLLISPPPPPLLSRSLSCFSSYLRHRRDIFSYFHPPIVSSLAWTQGKNDANETLFLWDNVGEKRWINDGCNLYRWKEQLLRCITLICRWNIRIYRSLKNIYFVLILRLFLDVEIIVFSFFFLLNWASRVRKKIRNNLAEESYMEYKIFIHFVFPLPDSKITSLSMIHRAAKYNWSLRKRPAREWSFMVTSRACSNTRSGM